MVRRRTRGAWGRGPRPVCCGRACRTKPARRGCEDEYIGCGGEDEWTEVEGL